MINELDEYKYVEELYRLALYDESRENKKFDLRENSTSRQEN